VLVVVGSCASAEFFDLSAPSVDTHVYMAVFSLYIAVDFIYVFVVPESTPQPGVILIHHVRILPPRLSSHRVLQNFCDAWDVLSRPNVAAYVCRRSH
jgi:hypothetical protein